MTFTGDPNWTRKFKPTPARIARLLIPLIHAARHVFKETPFEFTEESYAAIELLKTKYPDNYKSSCVIPTLFIAQKQNNNFLTLSAMNKIAKMLEMTPMQVYEVAAFYTMFNRTKVGKYHLQVCGTTPCMIRGVS